MICVARKARRVSSKLWHGRKDDEYLGFWDTFRAKRVLGVGGKKPSIRKNASKKGLLMRTGPTGGSLMCMIFYFRDFLLSRKAQSY